jgi:hypothetical protein
MPGALHTILIYISAEAEDLTVKRTSQVHGVTANRHERHESGDEYALVAQRVQTYPPPSDTFGRCVNTTRNLAAGWLAGWRETYCLHQFTFAGHVVQDPPLDSHLPSHNGLFCQTIHRLTARRIGIEAKFLYDPEPRIADTDCSG